MTIWREHLTAIAALAMIIVSYILWIDLPLAELVKTYDKTSPGQLAIFKSLTDLGKSKWYLWPTGLVTLTALAVMKFGNPGAPWRSRWRTIAITCGFLFACISISGLLVDGLKIVFGRARPVLLEQGIFGWDPFTTTSRWASFPSGHSNTMFALAFGITALWPRLAIPAFILAIIIASTRYIVAAHFSADVLMGAIIATFTSLIICYHFKKWGWFDK